MGAEKERFGRGDGLTRTASSRWPRIAKRGETEKIITEIKEKIDAYGFYLRWLSGANIGCGPVT